MAEVMGTIGIINSGIEAANNGLDLYNKILDQIIPMKAFEEALADMSRYKSEYSQKSAKLLGEITTLMMNGLSHYMTSTQSIYEWCDLTRRLLTDYVKLYDNYKPENAKPQKALILKVLEEGIVKMNAAQDVLGKCVLSFNEALGKLVELKENLTNDFNSTSEYYQSQLSKMRAQAYGGAAVGVIFGPLGLVISYSIAAGITEGELVKALNAKFESTKKFYFSLLERVQNTTVDIGKFQGKLQEEIKVIGELKVQTQETIFKITLDEAEVYRKETVPVVEKLIKDCEAYLARHGKKELTK